MDTARLTGIAEILVPLLVFLAVSLQRWKSGMANAWKQEAEAYKLRADRLSEEVSALTIEVRELRRENGQLRERINSLLGEPDEADE